MSSCTLCKRQADLAGKLGEHPVVILGERRTVGAALADDEAEQFAAVGDRGDTGRCGHA